MAIGSGSWPSAATSATTDRGGVLQAHAAAQRPQRRLGIGGQTDDYKTPLGLPAEILLAANPASMKVGDTLSFQALLKGRPMANQLVYASYDGHDDKGGAAKAVRMRTDASGHASFKISTGGKWFITLINMQKTTGDATYESNWSTVTFEIR